MPSGNFGNICAGHVARMMGLPIERLVLATNENDVLDEFFRTGRYRVRGGAETHETSSPSMDISKASNFERFVFDLLGRDAGAHARAVRPRSQRDGGFTLDAEPSARACRRFGFVSGRSTPRRPPGDDPRHLHERFGVVIDPHTADGLKVAREHRRAGDADGRAGDRAAGQVRRRPSSRRSAASRRGRPRFAGIEALPRRFVDAAGRRRRASRR